MRENAEDPSVANLHTTSVTKPFGMDVLPSRLRKIVEGERRCSSQPRSTENGK